MPMDMRAEPEDSPYPFAMIASAILVPILLPFYGQVCPTFLARTESS